MKTRIFQLATFDYQKVCRAAVRVSNHQPAMNVPYKSWNINGRYPIMYIQFLSFVDVAIRSLLII